jgi:UDP-glucuronate 4-epimerase
VRVLVTGAAGFIGFHLSRRLLAEGHHVVGVDSLNDYYDVSLKLARLALLGMDAEGAPVPDAGRGPEPGPGSEPVPRSEPAPAAAPGGQSPPFHRLDLADEAAVRELFSAYRFDVVVNLAAQAGVRYSITEPMPYAYSNVVGFLNVLEGCRAQAAEGSLKQLIYASTSSVYGLNAAMPFAASQATEHPVSLYAATKKANEMMAHSYSHLYGLPTTGLRFFTVYGPWGRPDMALFLFTKAILEGRPIDVYNHGKMRRDFTYVDDIVSGILGLLDKPAAPDPAWRAGAPASDSSSAPYRVYNIGRGEPVELEAFIDAIEAELGKKATRNYLPIQPGDVEATWADTTALTAATGYQPKVSVAEGVGHFVRWYREYYGV